MSVIKFPSPNSIYSEYLVEWSEVDSYVYLSGLKPGGDLSNDEDLTEIIEFGVEDPEAIALGVYLGLQAVGMTVHMESIDYEE